MNGKNYRQFVIRFAFVLLLTICLFNLQGCQSSTSQNKETDQSQILDRRIGTIQSLGGIANSNGATHLLRKEDGSTLLLKSASINLNDTKFAQKVVEVRGELTKITDGNEIMSVQNIDVLDQDIQLTTKAPEWTTYNGTTIPLSFKYRDDFVLTENSNSINLVKKATDEDQNNNLAASNTNTANTNTKPDADTQEKEVKININVISHDKDETILSYLKLKSDSQSALNAEGITKAKIGTNGLDAYKKTVDDQLKYYIADASNFYEISFSSDDTDNLSEDQNVFNQLVASISLSSASTTTSSTTINEDSDSKNTDEDTISTKDNETTKSVETKDSNEKTDTTLKAKDLVTNKNDSSNDTDDTASAEDVKTAIDDPVPTLTGYETFSSSAFKFSLQYPKKYYYGVNTASGTGKEYSFGTKPVDETPGDIDLVVSSGSIPTGVKVQNTNLDVTKVSNGDSVTYYVKGNGSRVYKISGPSTMDTALSNMASTLKEGN